jgi:hypothetical protein
MQAASDIFLGWLREPPGLEDLKLHDLYLRQLWEIQDLDRRRRDGAVRHGALRRIVRLVARAGACSVR